MGVQELHDQERDFPLPVAGSAAGWSLKSRFKPLKLVLFPIRRTNTSSVTRQLWSIWEVLITMQHKKPSLCRLYQPLKSWKASFDPGGAFELNKTEIRSTFSSGQCIGEQGKDGKEHPLENSSCERPRRRSSEVAAPSAELLSLPQVVFALEDEWTRRNGSKS